jgi:hypothetical protein
MTQMSQTKTDFVCNNTSNLPQSDFGLQKRIHGVERSPEPSGQGTINRSFKN